MKYLIGLLGIALGCLLIIKTEGFIESFGTSAWAEEHMGGSGGTRMLYKLIGLGFILLSLLGMFGLLGGIILGTFGRLFGAV